MILFVRAVILLSAGIFCQTIYSGVYYKQLNLKDLLPASKELQDWSGSGEIRRAAGKDLYSLIDGGAEIYYEYGFKEVVFQSYSHANGQSINLEIYEMNNPDAAYGVYTFKTGSDGIPLDIGQESWLESYFLNSWRGNYVITVTGLNEDTVTIAGIKKIAGIVDSKIVGASPYPQIISYLPRENLRSNSIYYLKGNLALFNYYLFSSANIFGVREGVIGEYPDYTVLIFQYVDQPESEKWYTAAKNHLKISDRFKDYAETGNTVSICDVKNQFIMFKQYKKWIVLIISNENFDTERIFNSLRSKLDFSN